MKKTGTKIIITNKTVRMITTGGTGSQSVKAGLGQRGLHLDIEDYDKSGMSENSSCDGGDQNNQLLCTQKHAKDRNNPFGGEPSMLSDTHYQDDLSALHDPIESARKQGNDKENHRS